MNDWETFHETSLSENEESHSNLNMKDIKDSDCNHAKKICKDLEIKNLGEYHDLHLKSDTLLFAMFFKNLERCAYRFMN